MRKKILLASVVTFIAVVSPMIIWNIAKRYDFPWGNFFTVLFAALSLIAVVSCNIHIFFSTIRQKGDEREGKYEN